jgi:hypothetical protein
MRKAFNIFDIFAPLFPGIRSIGAASSHAPRGSPENGQQAVDRTEATEGKRLPLPLQLLSYPAPSDSPLRINGKVNQPGLGYNINERDKSPMS